MTCKAGSGESLPEFSLVFQAECHLHGHGMSFVPNLARFTATRLCRLPGLDKYNRVTAVLQYIKSAANYLRTQQTFTTPTSSSCFGSNCLGATGSWATST